MSPRSGSGREGEEGEGLKACLCCFCSRLLVEIQSVPCSNGRSAARGSRPWSLSRCSFAARGGGCRQALRAGRELLAAAGESAVEPVQWRERAHCAGARRFAVQGDRDRFGSLGGAVSRWSSLALLPLALDNTLASASCTAAPHGSSTRLCTRDARHPPRLGPLDRRGRGEPLALDHVPAPRPRARRHPAGLRR